MKGENQMKINYKNKIRFWSIISGISLIIMAIAAGYAYGFSFNQIYVESDSIQTMINILANSTLYYSGVIVWCLILITDLIVAYGFYRYLKPVNKTVASLSGVLRLIYSIFLAIGIVFLFGKSTEVFLKMWSLGLIVIGLHLTVTGLGVFQSNKTPNILGVLLIIAGIGYSLIHGLQNFLPQIQNFTDSLESILSIPMTIGELSFGIWLLVRGGKNINQQFSDVPVQDAP
ncbi:MAG TPA: hypothetical protein DHM42_00210 [Clostridiales bacterium]|jgi:hypothetical protein|nr:hypothetical protein [Clostridiales bacterium]